MSNLAMGRSYRFLAEALQPLADVRARQPELAGDLGRRDAAPAELGGARRGQVPAAPLVAFLLGGRDLDAAAAPRALVLLIVPHQASSASARRHAAHVQVASSAFC